MADLLNFEECPKFIVPGVRMFDDSPIRLIGHDSYLARRTHGNDRVRISIKGQDCA